jgi:hypothetical protein
MTMRRSRPIHRRTPGLMPVWPRKASIAGVAPRGFVERRRGTHRRGRENSRSWRCWNLSAPKLACMHPVRCGPPAVEQASFPEDKGPGTDLGRHRHSVRRASSRPFADAYQAKVGHAANLDTQKPSNVLILLARHSGAGNRTVEYHFAEARVATYVSNYVESLGISNVRVFYTPAGSP